MRQACRERFPRHHGLSDPDMHHGTCVTHVPWCMPGSLTSGFRWSRWRGNRSRHSRRMRNTQFYVSGKRPMGSLAAACIFIEFVTLCQRGNLVEYICFWSQEGDAPAKEIFQRNEASNLPLVMHQDSDLCVSGLLAPAGRFPTPKSTAGSNIKLQTVPGQPIWRHCRNYTTPGIGFGFILKLKYHSREALLSLIFSVILQIT